MHTSGRQTITDRQKFILLWFLNIFFSINISSSVPLGSDQSQSYLKEAEFSLPSSSTSSSSPELLSKKRTLDGGRNPSELAWQAWLLLDNAGETDSRISSDSANMLRRITPKSIFIAPPLPSCPDGYQSDGMNRCVKNIQLDQDAHINFLLERLNAMYANLGKPKPQPHPQPPPPPPPPSSSLLSLSLPQATGPFQLNIPIVLDTTKNDTMDDNSNDKPTKSQDEDTIVTVYEVKDTRKQGSHEEKDEKIFFVENQGAKIDSNDRSTSNTDEKPVPIVEFVQETDSNITSIVNYNVPVISMSQIQNRTELSDANNVSINDKNINDDGIFDRRKTSNNSSISSTLVLVLTPSKHYSTSNITENMALTPDTNTEQGAIRIENNENMPTNTDKTSDNSPQDIKTFSTPIRIFFNDSESSDGSADIVLTTTVPIDESDITDENGEITSDYIDEDEEEHDVTTDHIEEDSNTSTESEEEILKHSEAGLSVTIPTIRWKPSLNSSDEETNMMTANVSSVVIINDDFIRETTLLGLNANRSVNISKDSKFNDDKTSLKSTNEDRVVVVTPKLQIAMKIIPKEIVPIINANNEENTESSEIVEKMTTRSFMENLETETITSITPRIEEISSTDSDNINPVVTIEEALMDEAINHRQQPSLSETSQIITSHIDNDNKSRLNRDGLDSPEMMTASSTNVAKIIFPRDEVQEGSPITPFMDETYNTKYIRASSSPRFEELKNNISTVPPADDTKQVYNYDALPQHHPNLHAYVIDDSQPVIKTIDDQRLEYNKNLPAIRTMNDQRFESNKNYNHRKNFFPNNFDTSFVDFTRNYVRFPNDKRPHTRPGNVRFPSDEANSIHTSDDLKERYNRPLAPSSNRGSIRTAPGESKQSNWRLPLSWRSDRQHPLSQRFRSNTNEQRQRDRSPMLMKFWTKMPLVKDPSLLYHPTYPTVVPVDTAKQHNDEQSRSSRMVNFYNEMSAYDQTRTFAQQSAVGG